MNDDDEPNLPQKSASPNRTVARLGAVSTFLAALDPLGFIFPPQCIACEQQLFDDDDLSAATEQKDPIFMTLLQEKQWCDDCLSQVRAPLEPRCQTCGALTPIHKSYRGRCRLCFDKRFHFSQSVCVNNYGGLIRELVIRMKGRKDDCLAFRLGALLGYEMERLELIEQVDVVTPVPMHWLKRLRTGFQASELICQRVSTLTNIPQSQWLLKSCRLTKKQGMLSGAKRIENVKDAFAVDALAVEKIQGKTVALIDDVMTSGATVNQCARVLKQSGAKEVVVAVVARGAKTQ